MKKLTDYDKLLETDEVEEYEENHDKYYIELIDAKSGLFGVIEYEEDENWEVIDKIDGIAAYLEGLGKSEKTYGFMEKNGKYIIKEI